MTIEQKAFALALALAIFAAVSTFFGLATAVNLLADVVEELAE